MGHIMFAAARVGVSSVACGLLLCASVLGAASPPAAQLGSDPLPPPEQTLAPGAKAISIIDSRTVGCVIPDPEVDSCEMRWQSLYVSAGSDYVTFMTFKIDGKARAIYTGFFQTFMYVPSDMQPEAFKVDCGKLGSGGDPTRGMAHTYYIEAFDTTGKLASNFGAVLCPVSVLLFRDGFESGSFSLWSGHAP
jgi:hypothetical protein